MNPMLRILWLAFGPAGIFMLLVLCKMLLIDGYPGTRRQFTAVFLILLGTSVFFGARFVQFSKARIWRWLPDGQKALKRAQSLVLILCLMALSVIVVRGLQSGILAFRTGKTLLYTCVAGVGIAIAVAAWRRWARYPVGLMGTSPEARLLESNGAWIFLPAAFAATLYVPFVFHQLLRIHARDSYTAVAGGAAGFAAVAILLIAMATAQRARLLWMVSGNSRAEVMKTCERSLFAVLTVLVVFAWLVPTVLSLIYTSSFNWERSALLVPVLFVAAIGPMYLGLALSTFTSWWRNMPKGHILLIVFLILPPVWRAAYAIVQPLEKMPQLAPVLYGFLAAIALRAFALWRWRKIDWTYMRRDLLETRR